MRPRILNKRVRQAWNMGLERSRNLILRSQMCGLQFSQTHRLECSIASPEIIRKGARKIAREIVIGVIVIGVIVIGTATATVIVIVIVTVTVTGVSEIVASSRSLVSQSQRLFTFRAPKIARENREKMSGSNSEWMRKLRDDMNISINSE